MIWMIRIGVVLGLCAVTYFRTDGFFLSSIEGNLSAKQAEVPSNDILEELSQPFRYLGKGRQCFVFESLDGEMVLKFFNHSYIKEPWYTAFLPKERRLQERRKRARRREFYLHSYEIAWKQLGEEIHYLHLGSSEGLPSIQLTDKGDRTFRVDLNQIPFVLQKKGILFYEGLNSAYQRQGTEGVKKEIETFLRQVAHRIDLNIRDSDHDVEHNWGYVDGRLFHLDPGRLHLDGSPLSYEVKKREWWVATHNFRRWLEKKYPETVPYLDELVNKRLNP